MTMMAYYVDYKTHIEKMNTIGWHEDYFYRPILNFLDLVLKNTDIQAIPCYKNRDDTKIHSNKQYSGPKGPPDILLARNYSYQNKIRSDIEYLVSIEVKVPNLYTFNEKRFIRDNINQEQIESHLSKVPKVIVTDGIRWYFLVKNRKLKIHESEIFEKCLVKSFNLKTDTGEWKEDTKVWNRLNNYILEFLKL